MKYQVKVIWPKPWPYPKEEFSSVYVETDRGLEAITRSFEDINEAYQVSASCGREVSKHYYYIVEEFA